MDYAGVDHSGDFDVNGSKLLDALIANNFRYTMRGKESGVDEIGADSSIAIVANGEVRADGPIEVYTTGGALFAKGLGKVSVATPGIYIVRTATCTRKLAVR